MDSNSSTTNSDSRLLAVEHLNAALTEGRDWPEALLEAMVLWTAPEEVYGGRTYNYFIAGEAFDWLLLAERLLNESRDVVPEDEVETLIFEGRFPDRFDTERIPELLGGDKYRGYLNYHYGVTVEEALQLACEMELRKRDTSNGVRYRTAYAEQVFPLIYRKSREELLRMFRETEDLDPRGRLIHGGAPRFHLLALQVPLGQLRQGEDRQRYHQGAASTRTNGECKPSAQAGPRQ